MNKTDKKYIENGWTPLDTDDEDIQSELEFCVITNLYYPQDMVTITYEGGVLASLWGSIDISFDEHGTAIMPQHIIDLFAAVNGRKPDLN